MANEITMSVSVSYDDSTAATPMVVDNINDQITVSSGRPIKAIISVGITEEALPLGEVATLGVSVFKNLDATNFIELRTGTGGTKFAKLKAGESAAFRFGSGVTAPYAIADTAACLMEYMLIPN